MSRWCAILGSDDSPDQVRAVGADPIAVTGRCALGLVPGAGENGTADLVVLPEAGHMYLTDATQAADSAVLSFLAAHPLQPK